MKRFHVHIAVDELAASIDFYTKLFGQEPSKQRPDYAKWMLDDPKLNFAISTQVNRSGLDHLGLQVESQQELAAIRSLADAASDGETRDQGQTACCYANSNKHWTVDPQGVAWEHFMTLSDTDDFADPSSTHSQACCIPLHASPNKDSKDSNSCCVPGNPKQGQSSCC